MKQHSLHKRPGKLVGLFGGTFDPIHNGHIKAAAKVKEKLKLHHIYFVPAYLSPFKSQLIEASPKYRLEMIKRAIKGIPDFSVSEFELNKKGISYTVDTVKHYKKVLPTDTLLFFILGNDAFLGISKWKKIDELFASCNFIVVSRPGYQWEFLGGILKNSKLSKQFIPLKKGKEYQHLSGNKIYFLDMESIDISSTELRKKIKQNEPYSLFVSCAVEDYIRKHDLYKCGSDHAQTKKNKKN